MSLSTVSNYVPSVSKYVPSVRISTPTEMARKIKKIAIPAIAIAAYSMLPKAQAITYVECIDECNSHRDAHPLAKLIYYAICLIFAE